MLFIIIALTLTALSNSSNENAKLISKDLSIKDSKNYYNLTHTLFCGEYVKNEKLEFIKETIAATETQHNTFNPNNKIKDQSWIRINKTSGAAGRYQFTKATRQEVAKYLKESEPSLQKFLKDKKMQDRYLFALLEIHNGIFKDSIKVYNKTTFKLIKKYPSPYQLYEGKVINGYHITKSGMIMIAHAIGTQGTINWLATGCKPEYLPNGAPYADRRLTIQIFDNE